MKILSNDNDPQEPRKGWGYDRPHWPIIIATLGALAVWGLAIGLWWYW